MAKFDLTRKSTWRKMISVGLALLLSVGAIFGAVTVARKMKEETKKIYPTWAIGSIDDVTGKDNGKRKTSLYTKEAFEAKGLEITLDLDSNLKYQVFFYDEVGEVVLSYAETNKGQSYYAPAGCKARVEITPNLSEDDDGEISWLESFKYSKGIEIRVDKQQQLKAVDFKEVCLTDSSVFTCNADQIFNFGTGNFENLTGIDTYVFANPATPKYSAVYVKDYKVGELGDIKALYVRLKDGTTIYYYNSKGTETEVLPGYRPEAEIKLPMNANEAIHLPAGSTLYVYGAFGETGASETFFMFY